ncbi:MAG: ABC transporter permease, partial [Streptosporangiales bacterium]|nr:ABC transporter permease [Streptosporangiales bacterium]
AHTALALPFVIVPVSSVLAGFDTNLERAAAVCGATRLRTFLQVTLPVKMYASVLRDVDPTIATAATLIIVITSTLIGAALLVTARRSRRVHN